MTNRLALLMLLNCIFCKRVKGIAYLVHLKAVPINTRTQCVSGLNMQLVTQFLWQSNVSAVIHRKHVLFLWHAFHLMWALPISYDEYAKVVSFV
ncbi:hypothetical protein C7445_11036 [Alicyclobacillus sacchari]|uniref:Uncharacterized protein n=1 Tax=Alicyclobacillus sacchari TaxID=392010 RepID=A0A4R8LJM6_9BACL|nr:hypothetical protein C7445_11036 [Alicyclobacillus sacchari]